MSQRDSDERKEDQPLYSRLFVVCSKLTKEQDLRKVFEEHGTVEDLYIPRDRTTGEPKGVAYVKYSKTSSAAAAIKNLHMKNLDHGKAIKVMVAANKNEHEVFDQYGDRYTRLFIKIPKDIQEKDIKDYFSQFGNVQSVFKMKDKVTGDYKGFAYVKFSEFYEAAKAFENCDKNYKPIFATPKDLKRSRSISDYESSHYHTRPQPHSHPHFHPHSHPYSDPHNNSRDYFNYNRPPNHEMMINDRTSLMTSDRQDYKDVLVICSPILAEKYIWQLMNIVPGMVKCHYSMDTYDGMCKAQVTYEDCRSAAYAVQKLNKYEFPSGEVISVKPDINPLTKVATDLTEVIKKFKNSRDSGAELLQLANAIEKASSLIKAAASHEPKESDASYCSVPLPPLQPVSNSSRCTQRLFIVCKPRPPPSEVLQDAFCRFGDFICVSTFPNKTFGYVKYASNSAAKEAIRVLDGASICGMKLKVLEADERPFPDKSTDSDQADHRDHDCKRMKFD